MTASVRRPTKSSKTRDAIVGAATCLFAGRSPDAVTIDDITREAAVAKGSFYNHFTDKKVLLQAMMVAIRLQIEPVIATANRKIDDPAARLVRGVAVYVRFALDEPHRTLVIVNADSGRALASDDLNRGLIADLANGLGSGRFNFATVDGAVLFVEGVVRHLMLRTTDTADEAAAIATSQQMCTMLLRGLGITTEEAYRLSAWAMDDLVRSKS